MRKHFFVVIGVLVLLLAACSTAEVEVTEAPVESEGVAPPEVAPVDETEPEGMPEGDPDLNQGNPPIVNASTYTIKEGTARFYIDETLLGADKTVVGETSAVSGEVAFERENPAVTATFYPISIDATTFVTDSDMRNRRIQSHILETSVAGNEIILFEPSEVEGLPDVAEVGATYEVTIHGILTMHGVSNPVAFTGTLTQESDTQISGVLRAENISYADWGIGFSLPNSVSWVADVFTMEFEFVATSS